MNGADRIIAWTCVLIFTFFAGFWTRAWSDRQLEAKRAALGVVFRPAPVESPGAGLLGCPVTRARLEEYARTCRARSRLEKVKEAPK